MISEHIHPYYYNIWNIPQYYVGSSKYPEDPVKKKSKYSYWCFFFSFFFSSWSLILTDEVILDVQKFTQVIEKKSFKLVCRSVGMDASSRH